MVGYNCMKGNVHTMFQPDTMSDADDADVMSFTIQHTLSGRKLRG